MNEFNSFLYGSEYPIVKWEEKEDINFWIEQQNDFVICPKCGNKCYKCHETHARKIQDTPIHNKKVFININAREFICENNECKINTFTEEFPFVDNISEGVAQVLSKQNEKEKLKFVYSLDDILNDNSCYNGWYLVFKYIINNYPHEFILELFKDYFKAQEFITDIYDDIKNYYKEKSR